MGNYHEFLNLTLSAVSRLNESKATTDPAAYTAPGHDLPWQQLDGQNEWKFCGNYLDIFGVMVVQWVDDSGNNEFYATFIHGPLDIPCLASFVVMPIPADGPGVAS